jgi:exopolysaccharide biosynthesis polyprenyl glycosylphosphotransferase
VFRILSTAVTGRQLILALGDVLCIILAIFSASLVYTGYRLGWDIYYYLQALSKTSLFIVAVHMVFFYFADVYDLRRDMLSLRYFTAVVLAVGLSLLFLGVCFFLFPTLKYGRAITLIHVLFLIVLVMGWRYIFTRFVKTMPGRRPVLLVGIEKCTVEVAQELMSSGQHNYRLAGYVSEKGHQQEMDTAGVPFLGGPNEIGPIVQEHQVQEVVLAPSSEKNGRLVRSLIRIGYDGVLVFDAVSFYERLTGKIPFDHLTDIWLLTHSLGNVRFFQWRMKRMMDIGLASVGLVLSSVALALAMIAIKLSSPGPIFYRQKRLGRNGMPFTLIKLRTMVPNAEGSTGAVLAGKNDPRVTRVGRFLRSTRIDEIPQLWNVLKGDMSLIGPRPERPEFVEQFEKLIPYYTERLAVRPGITGWAQVKYPYAATLEETKQKLQYDLFYIKNMSLIFDLLIIVMTIKTILFAKGQ